MPSMRNRLTPLQIVNAAFRDLGELPITSLTDTTNPRSLIAATYYVPDRDDMLTDHFWNFATRRQVLLPYSEPSGTLTPGATTGTGITFTTSTADVFDLEAPGKRLVGDGVAGEATIAANVVTTPGATLTPAAGALIPGQTGVVFTASAAVFGASDVGNLIDEVAGLGLARVTAFSDTTHVSATILTAWESVTAMASGGWQLVSGHQVTANITSAFASGSAIASGSWRLYNATPAWGYTYAMTVPSDCLRIQRTDESRLYVREGDYLLTDELTLSVTLCWLNTDVTTYSTGFVQAFIARLAADFAGSIADLTPKRESRLKIYEVRLKKAKKDDGQEGSAPQVTASDLVAARFGGAPGFPKRRTVS
jgi:hypothetical protein